MGNCLACFKDRSKLERTATKEHQGHEIPLSNVNNNYPQQHPQPTTTSHRPHLSARDVLEQSGESFLCLMVVITGAAFVFDCNPSTAIDTDNKELILLELSPA